VPLARYSLEQMHRTSCQSGANVAGSDAALESAALNLNFTRVTNPIAGIVSRAEVTLVLGAVLARQDCRGSWLSASMRRRVDLTQQV